MTTFKDHFSGHAATYAAARPVYPASLFAALAARCPRHALAWDAGTGNGQAALGLAAHFAAVHATDASAEQIALAVAHPRVRYAVALEHASGLPDASVDLVTVAQAAHWFDMAAFAAEARRVLGPGGMVAIWTYATCAVTPAVDAVVDWFYRREVGPYWPPERAHTENGYQQLAFPFAESPFPDSEMSIAWTRPQFEAYIESWSAVQRYRAATGRDPMAGFRRELVAAWADSASLLTVRWPVRGRLGTVATAF
jgi:ubiquinone/menaquinone biosynthesis C-methylase UbiE